jgi:hypothetical protein
MSNQAKLNEVEGKGDFFHLYLMDVPVVFATVQAPKDKWAPDGVVKGSLGKEYSLTAFINEETKTFLEDTAMINKSMFKVGVDKNKKRKIKFPLSSQDEQERDTYDAYEGMYGISLTLPAVSKKGKENILTVVDAEGNEFKELVGNGSICSIRCWGYRNQDELLNIQMDIVKVMQHVPYEGGSGGAGMVVDDELGVSVAIPEKNASQAPVQSGGSNLDDFDDDIPF